MLVIYFIWIYYFYLCFIIFYNKCVVFLFMFMSVMIFYLYWCGGSVIFIYDFKKWLFYMLYCNVFVIEDICEG